MSSVQLSQIMATLQRCQKPCCWRQFFHNRGKAGDIWEEHPGRHHNECSQDDSPQTPMFNKKGHLHGIPVRYDVPESRWRGLLLILCRVTSKQRALVFHSIQLRRYHTVLHEKLYQYNNYDKKKYTGTTNDLFELTREDGTWLPTSSCSFPPPNQNHPFHLFMSSEIRHFHGGNLQGRIDPWPQGTWCHQKYWESV